MPAPFPHRYEASLSWPGHGAATLTAESRPPIVGGAPPQFDGEPSWWSPEHLLLQSLNLCLMTTFAAFARRAGLEVLGYEAFAAATLGKTPGGLGFGNVTLNVRLEVAADDVARARDTLAAAKQHCIIANALMPPVHLESTVAVVTPELTAAS